jgi:hypothetical protein
MNNFLKTLNLIILGILILIFILYNLKQSFIKEPFQNQTTDINHVFFDLSANYFTLLESERAPASPNVPDTVILDIGGAFGEYDASRIPWDAENKELLPSEALYGIVPAIVSAALFSKIDQANQLSDVSKLPFDEESNAIQFNSPMIVENADAIAKEEEAAEITTQVAVVVAAMVLSESIESKFDAKVEADKIKAKTKTPTVQPSAASNLSVTKTEVKKIKPINFSKYLDNLKFSVTKVNKVTKEVGEKASKSVLKKVATIVGKRIGKFLSQVIIKSIVLSVSLKAIPPVWFGAALGTAYDIIVTPLILGLSLSGVIDKAIEKSADQEGCCPPGTTPLDSIIPSLLNDIIIGNIPIIGDILGFFYPYVCSDNSTGALVYKLTLTLPKYISYPWLSCYYLEWPEYNCRGGTSSPVNGKRLNGNSYDWNNTGIGPYVSLNQIIRNPEAYKQIMKEMKAGILKETEVQRIVPQGRKFVYADFTEPKMLIDMAQFYYNWASKDYYPNDDGTVTIEYISKINYVVASSLYTCDVSCEMVSVTFDPLTGSNYSETITYDRDRRFYYRVNPNVDPPRFWEDTNSEWRQLDDAYDLAMNDLNNFIYQDRFRNTKLDATVLTTAYRQMLDNSNRLSFITNIATNTYAITGPTGAFDASIREFNQSFIASQQALSNIPRTYLRGFTTADDATLLTRLSTIIGHSNALWEHHKSLSTSRSSTYVNNQYKIMGCTKIDATASSAANPDPLNLESDIRYFTNFNVLPYIKRCESINIDINKCIDPSNIDIIIYNYYLQNPTKRIKSINNIKAKGKNACEFIWDEVTYNPSTKSETDFRKNVNTTILYQQDLSSCTFDLPPPIAISGTSNYLFGSQTGGTTGLQIPPTSIKMFKNPLDSSSPNFNDNSNLTYIQAKYKFPVMPTDAEKVNLPINQQNRPKGFVDSNVDTIPRFDPATFKRLPDLIRPKKPIRIRYPNEEQKFLGNESNNYCSDPRTLSNIIMDYNGNSNNVNKIAKIIRTFTSSSNTCDLEVDMYIKDSKKIERKTITANVKRETFQNPFTYDSLNSGASGLNINTETDTLSNPYQLGFGYSEPYLRSFREEIAPNTAYFNDNLIKNFTDKTKQLRDGNYRILQGLVGTQKLGDPACNKRCSDDEIVQRIVEQYNKDGVPKTRFDVKQESVRQVVNSATASSNTCHVILDTKNEYYGDYYGDKSSSNYSSDFRLKLKKVEMSNLGNCTFNPLPNQIYQDISASDLALTSSSNFNTFKKPIRVGCVPVNCRDEQLYNRAFDDYKDKTGNTIDALLQSMNIGTNTCDYLIESQINIEDELLDPDNYILRVNYNNTLYQNGMNSNCSVNNTYSYQENNFKLQVPLELGELVDTDYYEVQDSQGSNASPLVSYDGTPSDPIHEKINRAAVRFS